MSSEEEWRPVVGHEGRYEVSNLGRVRSLDRGVEVTKRVRGGAMRTLMCRQRGRMLRPGVGSHGYPTVAIRRYSNPVHALVAAAFLGPRPAGHQVRHLDGDRRNPRLSNLAYGTPAENRADAERHGTAVRGTGYRNAKLTEQTARQVRALKGVVSQSRRATMFGVSPSAIQAVDDGRTWTHA